MRKAPVPGTTGPRSPPNQYHDNGNNDGYYNNGGYDNSYGNGGYSQNNGGYDNSGYDNGGYAPPQRRPSNGKQNFNYGYNKPPPIANNSPPSSRGPMPNIPPRNGPPRATYETPARGTYDAPSSQPPPRNNYNAPTPIPQSSPPSGAKGQNVIQGERTVSEKISDYLVNNGAKAFFIGLWFAGNVAFFTWKFYEWQYGPKAAICAQTLGLGRPFARGAAECIKFNSALMALTMVRNFLSWIRGTFLGNIIPVDKHIIFHRYIAWTICFFVAIHMTCWFFNYNGLSSTNLDQMRGEGCPYAEPTRTVNATAYSMAFFTLPGSTGHLLVLVMALMYSAAIRYVRGPMFNVFWYTHHLFILFWGLLIIHGTFVLKNGSLTGPTFGYYFIFPGLLYLIERIKRLVRGSQDTILQLAVAHPSKVLELQMKKASFKYKPGQYLFLNCPYLAAQEWHPFTISSAPEEDFVSVHIRIVGDWTGDLWNLLNPDKKLGQVAENLIYSPNGSPILRIDGPYGAASEEVFGFKTVMLVAGGIGVTPFSSILKSIRYKLDKSGQTAITKVYFYWISRDKNAFEWINDILSALEQENINNFLDINIYLTGQLSVEEIRTVMFGFGGDEDQITGLQSPTFFGRPDWNSIFSTIGAKHRGEDIGVFFCGPSALSKQLYRFAIKYTSTATSTRFKYHKENF